MRDVATRVVVLVDGIVVEEGAPHTVLTARAHKATTRVLDVKVVRPVARPTG